MVNAPFNAKLRLPVPSQTPRGDIVGKLAEAVVSRPSHYRGTGVPSPEVLPSSPVPARRQQFGNTSPGKPENSPLLGAIGKGLHWAFPHNPFAHPGRQLEQTGSQLGQSFDPRTRAGLVNILSVFAGGPKDFGEAGGPKGDATPMMGKLGMPGQFRDYNGAGVNPLARGIPNEGPGAGAAGAGIRGLVRRSQGVGGYRQPNQGLSEMTRLEAVRKEQSAMAQKSDLLKGFNNLVGEANQRADNLGRVDKAMGANTVPYSPRADGRPFYDTQSHDFTDRNALLNLQKQMPGNPLLGSSEPLMQALHDMLFRQGKFFGPIPRRP